MMVFQGGGKPEYLEKIPQSKARNNNKLNPLLMTGPGFIEPGPHWCSGTAPSLLPKKLLSKVNFTSYTVFLGSQLFNHGLVIVVSDCTELYGTYGINSRDKVVIL